jgi:BsuBI/PstI restriction endonuclease domain/BsuBI/PstI restriction endonuclease HTH domain
MARLTIVQVRVNEALEILGALGVPLDGLTPRRREKMAKAFLAVAGLQPKTPWADAKDSSDGRQLLSRQIIAVMNLHWGEAIADSSYDDIRRKDLVLPVAALVVLNSAKNPHANTNDGTRGFALNPAAAFAIRTFGTPQWPGEVAAFLQGRRSLAEQLQRMRNLARIPVQIKEGLSLTFSPGAHNLLQKQVIESFLPIFGFGAQVLYVGDTANKSLFVDQAGLADLAFFELAHDKLPDVVAYSKNKNWLYLIEAVTTVNPISELRRRTLSLLTAKCKADVIYVSAFADRASYKNLPTILLGKPKFGLQTPLST